MSEREIELKLKIIMATEQNGTKYILNPKQEAFVKYMANMQRDAEGNKISMDQFAEIINVDRKTLYVWKKEIPNFNQLVADATDDVYLRFLPKAAVINMSYAAKGSYQHMKLIYQQAGRLKAEKQEMDVNHTGEVTFANHIPRTNNSEGS